MLFYFFNYQLMKNLKKALATIAYKEMGTIRACVAEEALQSGEDYLE